MAGSGQAVSCEYLRPSIMRVARLDVLLATDILDGVPLVRLEQSALSFCSLAMVLHGRRSSSVWSKSQTCKR
eukprot:2557762-Amphidinium_carterae.1